MSENTGHVNGSRSPLTDPFLLDLSDIDLLTILRGGKLDVHELNLRISVGGSGARQVWDLRRRLAFISRYKVMPKKDQTE